jgi:hypothetical protein
MRYIRGFQNFWVSPSGDWEQVPLVGGSYVPFPHGPLSPAKIMTLGRWSSDAFLVYIRPQVLEWTNNVSCNMIHLDSFSDAPHQDLVAPDDP